jgi:hypothetical protein
MPRLGRVVQSEGTQERFSHSRAPLLLGLHVQMSDAKGLTAAELNAPSPSATVFETVTGFGREGVVDGSLDMCQFRYPYGIVDMAIR